MSAPREIMIPKQSGTDFSYAEAGRLRSEFPFIVLGPSSEWISISTWGNRGLLKSLARVSALTVTQFQHLSNKDQHRATFLLASFQSGTGQAELSETMAGQKIGKWS